MEPTLGKHMTLVAAIAVVALAAPSAVESTGIELGGLDPVGGAVATEICTAGYEKTKEGTTCKGIYLNP